MPENPLLPHRRLKALYALMKRIDALGDPKANDGAALAAALTQMEAGDFLCCTPEILALISSLNRAGKQTEPLFSGVAVSAAPAQDRALSATCTVVASGLKALGAKNATIVLTASKTVEGWQSALTDAQSERLPLVFVVTERSSASKPSKIEDLTWPMMTRMTKKLRLPTISVDGEDAVALYRVIQESLHRAKHGDGPAVIWCSFPSRGRTTVSARSIANMENYLAARGLGPGPMQRVAKA